MILAQAANNGWLYFGLVLLIAYFGLILFCLMDVLKGNFKNPVEKLVWVAVILFFPFLGSVIYLFMGRKNKL